MEKKNKKAGLLSNPQIERFIQLTIEQSFTRESFSVKRLYPWWQIPIRVPAGKIHVYLKMLETRYMDAEEPRFVGLVRFVSKYLDFVEGLLPDIFKYEK